MFIVSNLLFKNYKISFVQYKRNVSKQKSEIR